VRNLVTANAVEPRPTRVVIAGGGAAGVITATHLLRGADPDHPVDVRIIEKQPAIGPGLAYRTKHPRHTLNNFAGRLSAVDGDPDHLLRWCADHGHPADPTSFLPRELYGRYLVAVLDDTDVSPGSMLRRNRGVVTDVREEGSELAVHLSCGWTVPADKVVLALGNPPPRRWPEHEGQRDRYLPDPWVENLSTRVGSAREVLLLGTGLTMVDVVAQLHEASPGSRFTAASRHGLLPAAHKRGSSRLHDMFHPGTSSLDAVLAAVGNRIQELQDVGGDWRDVVDSVRAYANDLWHGFNHADQDRFVAEVARSWEIVRHRMAPEMATHIDHLRRTGSLHIARIDEVDPSRFDRIVNCTGPAPVPTRGWNPLVDTLLDRGSIRAHRLGLGLDLDPQGRVLNTAGEPHPDIYAVGAARRGVEWEVAAIPDLRGQAARLAAHLTRAQEFSGFRTAVLDEEVRPA
jgi:uncharacterized NAD(P)/FAD-binding protein YdhS